MSREEPVRPQSVTQAYKLHDDLGQVPNIGGEAVQRVVRHTDDILLQLKIGPDPRDGAVFTETYWGEEGDHEELDKRVGYNDNLSVHDRENSKGDTTWTLVSREHVTKRGYGD